MGEYYCPNCSEPTYVKDTAWLLDCTICGLAFNKSFYVQLDNIFADARKWQALTDEQEPVAAVKEFDMQMELFDANK